MIVVFFVPMVRISVHPNNDPVCMITPKLFHWFAHIARPVMPILFCGSLHSALGQEWQSCAGTEGLNMQCAISRAGWEFMGGELGTFHSNDAGANFVEANTGNTSIGPTRGFTADDEYVYQCTSNGVFRSEDHGMSWQPVSSGLPQLLTHGMARSEGRIWVVTQTGVFVTLNQGESWASAGLDGVNVRCITELNESMYVGTIDEGLFKTSDYGQSWIPINNGSNSNSFRAIESHGTSLFAGGEIGTGVFRSQDEGNSWELLTGGGLPAGSYRGFASHGEWIAAGSFMAGVFVSSDDGDTWTAINDGLQDLSIFDLEFSENFLFAATNTAGAWRLDLETLPSVSLVSDSESVPFEAFPNPTQGEVRFQCSGDTSDRSWQVWSLDGRLLREGAGTLCDLSDCSPATYIIRSAGESIRVVKCE